MPPTAEEILSAEVKTHPDTCLTHLFGLPALRVEGRIVALATESGLALRLPAADRAEAMGLPGASPLLLHGRRWRGWIVLPAWLLDDLATAQAWLGRASGRAPMASPELVDELPASILAILSDHAPSPSGNTGQSSEASGVPAVEPP